MNKNVVKMDKKYQESVDTFDPESTHDLLIITPNLESIEFIMMYYMQIGIIRQWKLQTDDNSFITSFNAVKNIIENKAISEYTSACRVPFINKSVGENLPESFKRFVNKSPDDAIALYPISKKSDILIDCMGDSHRNIRAEAVIYFTEDDDFKFKSMLGNKWYRMNSLRNIDLFSAYWWYKRFYSRFIKKAKDSDYLVLVKVEFADEWYMELF